MTRSANLTIFLVLSFMSWIFHFQYPSETSLKILYTLISITAIYLIFSIFLTNIATSKIKDSKTRYSARKSIFIVELVIILLVLARIWVENTQNLLVAYGLGAAGVAIALQDILKNFVGGIIVFASNLYKVGDRIEIGGTIGDVIDVGLLYTTILETGAWVDGDQATGRLTMVPNGKLLAEKVDNYTKDHEFLWDEIMIPITYDSDWKQAMKRFLEIVRKEAGESARESDNALSKLQQKYFLSKRSSEPRIYINLTDNWVELHIRYVSEVRKRREINDRISRKLLEYCRKTKKITIASESFDVNLKK